MLRREVQEFIKAVKKSYTPELFLLFGSRAKNTNLPSSDYDMLIISKKFEGVPFTDRLTPIHKLWHLMEDLECICITPKEYSRTKTMVSVIRKAVSEGVAL